MNDRTIYMATSSVLAEYDGRPLYIHQGMTTVRAGHPLLETFGDRFEPLRPTFEVDDEPEGEADTEDTAPEPEKDAPVEKPEAPEPTPADVRAWAAEQGIEVPARGKIPTEVSDAYKAAHSEA